MQAFVQAVVPLEGKSGGGVRAMWELESGKGAGGRGWSGMTRRESETMLIMDLLSHFCVRPSEGHCHMEYLSWRFLNKINTLSSISLEQRR